MIFVVIYCIYVHREQQKYKYACIFENHGNALRTPSGHITVCIEAINKTILLNRIAFADAGRIRVLPSTARLNKAIHTSQRRNNFIPQNIYKYKLTPKQLGPLDIPIVPFVKDLAEADLAQNIEIRIKHLDREIRHLKYTPTPVLGTEARNRTA